MIKLEKYRVNDVIFTLNEKESTTSFPNYKLSLKNSQSNESILHIPIYDLSTHTERYDEFYLGIGTLSGNTIYSTNTTLTANTIYFIAGNITVNSGVTLTIPPDTWIIQSTTGMVTNNGTITRRGNIIPDSDLTSSSQFWTSSSSPDITESTYIFGLVSGYYDYTVYNNAQSVVLETGKLFVDRDTETISTYSNTTDHTYTYQG